MAGDTPNLSSLNDVRPNIPPPQQTDIGQAPDLGNLPIGGVPTPQPIQPSQQAPPPRPGTGIGTPPPPINKADFFRKMLGDFFYAAGTGLANAGHGPGSFGRGLGAGLEALPQRDIAMQQLAIQRQNAQAAEEYRKAQAASLTPTIKMVDPNGNEVMVPPAHVGQALAAQYRLAGTQATATAGIVKQGMGDTSKEKIAGENIASKEKIAGEQIGSKEKMSAAALQEKRNEFYSSQEFKKWKTNADNETKQRVASLTQSKAPAAVMQSAIFANSGLQRLGDMDTAMDTLEKSGVMGSLPKNWVENWVFGKGAVDPSLPPDVRRTIGQLRSAAELTSSATMRAHTGRTSREIYDDFKNMLGPGQDWNALRGAMDETRSTLGDYVQGASDASISNLRTGGGNSKAKGPLSLQEAQQYLQQAGGDKNKARALAKKDGRTF